jgi:hypothetical protein
MAEANRSRAKLSTMVSSRFWMVNVFPFRKWLLGIEATNLMSTWAVQYIPAWLPGATFRRLGIQGAYLAKKVRFDGFNHVKENMVCAHICGCSIRPNIIQANGIVDESMVSKYISDPTVSKDHLRDAVGSMYLGE